MRPGSPVAGLFKRRLKGPKPERKTVHHDLLAQELSAASNRKVKVTLPKFSWDKEPQK